MEPIKIYPGTDLRKELAPEVCEAVMEWFRSNGVDPNGVPASELVTIDSQIDFWWVATQDTPEPKGARVLERTFEADEFPRSHQQVSVHIPLPPELETSLRELQARRDGQQADLAAKLFGVNAPCPNCGHQRDL